MRCKVAPKTSFPMKESVILADRESAEIEEMKARIKVLEEKKAVTKLLAQYKKGGKIAVHDTANDRYVIRIPKALQIDGQVKVTADTEAQAYHKVYTLLCKPAETLRDIFQLAMEERDHDPNLTDRTQLRMRQFWNRYYDGSVIAARPIREITGEEITTFLRTVSAGQSMTRTTYTNCKSILNAIYDYAVTHNIVQINVARQVHIRQRFKPQGDDIYTDEMRTQVLTYIEDNQKWNNSIYYAAIYIMFHLCCRIGEIKALRWTDYDEAAGTLRIRREVVLRNGKNVELEHTKSSELGNRTQYLPLKAQALLKQLRTLSKGDNDLIFPTATGLYLSTTKVNEALKRISNKLGIKYMSSHKIRFWAVTALCRQTGGDITAVGAYAGQACRQTTLHYIRKAQDAETQREAARRVFG